MVRRNESAVRTPPETRRRGGLDRLPDDELLASYLGRGDEDAFGAILARHGPRVLSVCRQVLGRSAEVDDAFQGTFLLLATRAGAIRNPESLGAWLCGVAHRIAVRTKVRTRRRTALERRADPPPGPSGEDDVDLPQVRRVLHAEVDRLPERFRGPVLLCYMEGRTNEEAARLLGCPAGTLKDRLARGREILRGRLDRRGVGLTVAFLLLVLPGSARAEEVPAWLVAATADAARGRAGRGGRAARASSGFAAARVAPAAALATALLTSTFAWVLFQPSPARGTWARWVLDLAHKVCG